MYTVAGIRRLQIERTYPLPQALIRRIGLPWYWAITVIAIVLVLLAVLAALLDGSLSSLYEWGAWSAYWNDPLLIIYISLVGFFLVNVREKAIETFRPLLNIDDDAFDELAKEVAAPNRRWELIGFFIGICLVFGIGQPWTLEWGPGEL